MLVYQATGIRCQLRNVIRKEFEISLINYSPRSSPHGFFITAVYAGPLRTAYLVNDYGIAVAARTAQAGWAIRYCVVVRQLFTAIGRA